MCAALALLQASDSSRRLYLYDTFEGMVPPDADDIDFRGHTAAAQLLAEQRTEDSYIWGYAPLEVVRRNMVSTRLSREQGYLCAWTGGTNNSRYPTWTDNPFKTGHGLVCLDPP